MKKGINIRDERSTTRSNDPATLLDQTKVEGTDGLDGENVALILRHDGPINGWANSAIRTSWVS